MWSPLTIALAVANGVLAVVLIVALVMLAGNGDSTPDPVLDATAAPSPSATPDSESAPPADESTDDPHTQVREFVLPSGNIWCRVGDRVTCTIAQVDEDSSWPACEPTAHQVQLRQDGPAIPVCPADAPAAQAPSGYETVDYGGEVANEHFNCEVTEAGVACRSLGSGSSFNLARAGLTVT